MNRPVRSTRLIVPLFGVILGLCLVGEADAQAGAPPPFPHEAHEGLFPVCTGCHAGVPSENRSAFYPAPASCAGCHDGTTYALVDWMGPSPLISNLSFDHVVHATAVTAAVEPATDCASCHLLPGAEERMSVVPLEAGRCLDCHGEVPSVHFERQDCATCHVPVGESRLTPGRLANLASPTDHADPAYLLDLHGGRVQDFPETCATCHTRPQCTGCHVDPDLAPLDLVPLGPTEFGMPAIEPRYPAPPSHADPRFQLAHARDIREAAEAATQCATCHTRDDCASCHLAPLPRTAAALPEVSQVRAPGVGLSVAAPESHASPFFASGHAALAAAKGPLCASCHTDPFCTACHQAAARPVFHPDDFVTRHPAAAWGANSECASCHETQVFCRSCHIQAGLGITGRPGPAYHDAEPLFLLRHGQAARQSLESCVSCHEQRDCVQCHSVLGGFRVNPHGPGFNASRARSRNVSICFACHLSVPRGG